jgi:ribose 5-phosphate isomerase RpiB
MPSKFELVSSCEIQITIKVEALKEMIKDHLAEEGFEVLDEITFVIGNSNTTAEHSYLPSLEKVIATIRRME